MINQVSESVECNMGNIFRVFHILQLTVNDQLSTCRPQLSNLSIKHPVSGDNFL